jgi:MFS family permease
MPADEQNQRGLPVADEGAVGADDRYKWVALANTTAAVFMSQLDGSIVLISLPAIFRGIHLDPLASSNIGYLLWILMGYRLVQAVLVVTVGRLGDMYGRVRIYNAGFVVFTAISIGLFFSLMIGGLSSRLPTALTSGLERQGVASSVAHHVGSLPPVSSLFASMLGVSPLKHLLALSGTLSKLSASAQHTITGHEFFPSLISGPFHHGLVIVFSASAELSVFAGLASLLRGGRYVDPGELPPPADVALAKTKR